VATTETKSITIDDAVESLLAPVETEEEIVEEEAQTTEEITDEVEESAETEASETEVSEEDEDPDIEGSSDVTEEDDDEAIEDAGQEELEGYSVKIDGQEVQVTLDDLKQGYSGQQYVQKGMQEAAHQRKEAESVYEALLNERQQVQQLYQQLQSGELGSPPVSPSREMFENDPLGYMDDKMKYDEAKESYDKQIAGYQQVVQQNAKAEQLAKQAYMKREMEQLQIAIPEFSDSSKAKEIKSKLVNIGGKHYGYTAEEIGQVMDHRALKVLNDAMKYQEIIAGKSKAVKKTRKAKPVLKAGAKRSNKVQPGKVRDRQQAKLRNSGSIEDALGLILNA
jgi:hypothetical protein